MKIAKMKIRRDRPETGMPWTVTFPKEFSVTGTTWTAWDLEDALRLMDRILRYNLGDPCSEDCYERVFCQGANAFHTTCGYCETHEQPLHHCGAGCWEV